MKVKSNRDMLRFKIVTGSHLPVRKTSLDIKLKKLGMKPTRRSKIVF